MEEPKLLLDCRHFLAGRCLYGASCMHRHDPVAQQRAMEVNADATSAANAQAEADAAFFECERRVNTLRRERAPRDVLVEAIRELDALKVARRALLGSKPRSRYARRARLQNEEKCGLFRRFLEAKFGAERLRRGSGVLDVAGGRGGLAFELVNIANVPTTVVDPRPLGPGIARVERKWQKMRAVAQGPDDAMRESACVGVGVGEGEAAAAAAAAADSVTSDATGSDTISVDNGGAGGDRGSGRALGSATSEAALRSYAARLVHRDWQLARAAASGGRSQRPAHWPCCWQPELYSAVVAAKEAEPDATMLSGLDHALAGLLIQAKAMKWTRKGLERGGEGEDDESDEAEEDGDGDGVGDGVGDGKGAAGEAAVSATSRLSASTVWATLRDASAVVGMHPDGATEPIIDFALATGKPWAVVPCCVYSADAPLRRDPRTGKRIVSMSTDAFIDYLVAKGGGHSRVGVETLPFAGKNRVVFSRPDVLGREEDQHQDGDPAALCITCDAPETGAQA